MGNSRTGGKSRHHRNACIRAGILRGHRQLDAEGVAHIAKALAAPGE